MNFFKLFSIVIFTLTIFSTNGFSTCPLPVPVSAGSNSRCGSGSITVQVSTQAYSCATYPAASSVSFNWYSASTGGTLLYTTFVTQNPANGIYNTQQAVTISATTDYWVCSKVSGVESGRVKITATIESTVVLSTLPSPQFNSRCGAGQLNVEVGGPNPAIYNWYSSSTATTPFATTTAPLWSNSNISTTTTYYVTGQPSGGTCPATSKFAVVATVNPALAPPTTATDQYRYGPGPVTLSVSGIPNGAFCYWYTTSTGGSYIYSGTSYSISNLTSTTTYYVATSTNSSCYSSTRKAVTGYVYPVPVVTGPNIIYTSDCPITLTSASTYTGYEWRNSKGDLISTAQSIQITKADTYTLKVFIGPSGVSATATPFIVTSGYNNTSLPLNYVASKTVNIDNVKDVCTLNTLDPPSVNTKITYIDGLGRSIQEIDYKASPTLKDQVQPIEYDNAGRVAKQYLPYSDINGNGAYKSDYATAQPNFYNNSLNNNADRIVNDANPYSVSVFDESRLNRVMKVLPPGSAWQGTGVNEHSNKSTYRTNTDSEVRYFKFDHPTLTANLNGYYAAGSLRVSSTSDEDNNTVWEYKDNSGLVVLKRRQNLVTNEFLDTYYVSDDFGNLRFVMSPQATSNLLPSGTTTANLSYYGTFSDQWLFTYKYDERGRIIEKKDPGSAVVYYVYDNKDRLVLSQDGNQRTTSKWSYNKYDLLDRLLISGIYTHTAVLDQASMQTLFTNSTNIIQNEIRQAGNNYGYSNTIWPTDITKCEVLSVKYYDDYDFDFNGTADYSYISQGLTNEAAVNNYVQNQLTGSLVKILGSTSDYLKTVQFFDKYYRTVQIQKNNHKNLALMSDLQTSVYDFSGKVVYIKQMHNAGNNPITIINRFEYDHSHRPTKNWQKINTDSEVLLSQINYNELGQIIEKNLHSENTGTTFLQSVDYTYNIRGWLTYINNPSLSNDGFTNNDANDLFGMQLNYETVQAGSTPKFNGSISSQRFKGNTTPTENIYRYFYDGLNSLNKGDMGTWNGTSWVLNSNFKEDGIQYDKNGNIISLQRSGDATHGNLDNLSYTYTGNRLVKVIDGGDVVNGFVDGNNDLEEYTYDNNGNMTSDKNKGISTIIYNNLNVVQEIQFGVSGNKIVFTYSADGIKLSKKVYSNGSTKTWDYIGSFVYTDNVIDFISTDEGRATIQGTSYSYEYNIKDHLGSVRMSFSKNTSGLVQIIQEDHYYPFGLKIISSQYAYSISDNKMLYTGKERQDELGLEWYDFGARMYDAVLGRWHAVDPLADQYHDFSPYNFCLNSPINLLDPNGEGVEGWYQDENQEAVYDKNINSQEDLKKAGIKGTYIGKTGSGDKDGNHITLNADGTKTIRPIDVVTVTPANKNIDWTPINNAMIAINEWNPLANLVNGISGFIYGEDINGRPMNGIQPGLKMVSAVPIPVTKIVSNGLGLVVNTGYKVFQVGSYNLLRKAGGGLTAHHAGQKAIMSKLIPNYNWKTAPSILVPATGHTVGNGVLSRVTSGFDNARQVLARDILELRRVYPNIPNSSLQELIQLNKTMYPEAFAK